MILPLEFGFSREEVAGIIGTLLSWACSYACNSSALAAARRRNDNGAGDVERI